MSETVTLCRCHMNGKTSMVLTVDKAIREYLAIQEKDVIAFRHVVVQGKRMILGEKLPLWKVAQFNAPQVPPAPEKKGG